MRDQKNIRILECKACGLVTLDSHSHIGPEFYEKSGMHSGDLIPIDKWLKETHVDDLRRFEMLRPNIENKRVLDFGCGAVFLQLAEPLAEKVSGIELEERICHHWRDKREVVNNINKRTGDYDLVTAFHVFERLSDPREVLRTLAKTLN